MQRITMFLATALTAAISAPPAHADVLDATFSGTVSTQSGTAFVVGAAIGGEFTYDTDTGRFLSFEVGGRAVAPGYASSAAITPDLFSAIYQAQVTPVGQPGASNSTFSLDLESLAGWPSQDAVALLTDASQLATNLDATSSGFGFYTGSAGGGGVQAVTATLGTLAVTAVPEPETIAMLLCALGALGLMRVQQGRKGR